MSDPNVREIQLGGKQLVFLFMASVVIAVAIFLLGISVGRGVGAPEEPAAAQAEPADEQAPVEMPPPTVTTPSDRGYHDALQGQTSPPPQTPPKDDPKPAASEPAAADTTSVSVAKPAPAPASASAPAPAERTPTTAATPKPTTAPATGGWYVQVAAFKSRENADRQIGDLKAKGYSAVVQSDPGSLFRVRIGPFKDRAAADRTADQLRKQDGIRASVGR